MCLCAAQALALVLKSNMFLNFQKSQRISMQQIQSFMCQIQKLDGRNRLGSWFRCCIQVKYQSGIHLEFDLRVPRLKLLEVVQAAQNLLLNSSNLQLDYLREQLDESLRPLNATIFAVKSLK